MPLVSDPPITIHEVGPGDEAAIAEIISGLDAGSRVLRWFSAGVDLRQATDWAAHPQRFAAVGLLAVAGEQPVGHAAIVPAGHGRGEVAFEVAANWRRHGIAGALLERLINVARSRGLREVYADVLPANADMLAVLREHGEHTERHHDGIVTITIPVRRHVPFAGLDEPVARYLTHALGGDGPAPTSIRMTSRGRIDVGRWLAFTAEQEFDHHNFEWRARAGLGRVKPVHVVDRYRDGAGSVAIRLGTRLRVTHSSGEDVSRAAAGRAAAESIWVPGTLVPGAGATWRAESDELIVARFAVRPEHAELQLTIDPAGAVRSVRIMRWGNVGRAGFGYIPYGGDVHAERRFGSLVLPSRLTVGWWYGTPRYAPMFETEILSAEIPG